MSNLNKEYFLSLMFLNHCGLNKCFFRQAFVPDQIISGNLKAGDDADAVDWFSINQLPEIAFYATQTMINRWKERQL